MLGSCISKIKFCTSENPDVLNLCYKYQAIFENTLGTFNTGKITLQVNDNATPKFFKPRPVPFALKPKIEPELDRLIKNKVLVPIEFSEWAAPIVPIIKPNGTVRICEDFKVSINAVLKTVHYPLL